MANFFFAELFPIVLYSDHSKFPSSATIRTAKKKSGTPGHLERRPNRAQGARTQARGAFELNYRGARRLRHQNNAAAPRLAVRAGL